MRDKIGYMLGDFGNDFFFILSSSFLMLYYTGVLGISPSVVGTLFIVARFVDAFTDIGMGRLVDTCKIKPEGRFRPWIKRMRLPVVVAGVLLFAPFVSGAPMTAKIVYIFITYILWGSICYTSINIPYGSMASAISAEPADRASLSTFRSVGAALAGATVGTLVPLFIYVTDKSGAQQLSGTRFFIIALVFAVLAYICYTFCYKLSTERIRIETKPVKLSPGALVSGLVHNRALMSIIAAAIVLLLAMLLTGTMNTYLFNDYFKNKGAMALAGLLQTFCTLVLAPFAGKIIVRFGKREASIVALLFASAIYLIMFILRLENAWIFCALVFIGNLGSGLFNLMIWAYITDVIDEQEVKTNSRDDGTVYAVYSFARKIGQALAGGLGGYALAFIGYQSGGVQQSQAVVQNVYNMATLVPTIGYLLVALVLILWYPLGKKQVAANQLILKEKRAASK